MCSTIANAGSPLLRLPPEIRNMIFGHATRWRYDVELYYNGFGELSMSGYSTYCSRAMLRFLGLRLPQVCRQIYSETATVLYRENNFSFIAE